VTHVITRMIVGGAQETVLLAAAFADRSRFDPVIVTGPQTGPEGSLHQEIRRRGIDLVILPELVREVSPVKDLRGIPALTRLLRQLRPAVVQTHSSKAGIVGRVAARRAGVPAVLHTVHGWPFHQHQPAAVRALWQGLERHTAPLADRLVVVAESDRDKGLAARVGRAEQYVTVRSGLELAQYGPDPGVRSEVLSEFGWPSDARVVGAVNRLSPQKDPFTLVEAFAVVAARRRDARFLVAGDGPLRSQVEAKVATLGLADRVVLAGLREDVPRLLKSFDVFVSTSLWEGLPRTVVAAFATEVPVVATPADGVIDVVTDRATGMLAPTRSPDLVGEAVLNVLEDNGLRARCVKGASALLPQFDARRMVSDLERLYEELL
jgi:glycosyltransferase involved in cell wall biosynthesis